MLAGDEQNVAETLFLQRLRFLPHFIERERDAQNRIVARKTAVGAIVDALVGKIERREQPDGFAETLLRHRVRAAAERLQDFRAGGRNQRGKIGQRNFIFPGGLARGGGAGGQRFFDERLQRQRIEFSDKTHGCKLNKIPREVEEVNHETHENL